MSLTSHLADNKGAVSLWMRARFPLENRLAVLKACRPQMSAATTLLPCRVEGDESKYPYSLIGTALDYRLRLYFGAFEGITVAHWGACMICDSLPFAGGEIQIAPEPSGSRKSQAVSGPTLQKAVPEFFSELEAALLRLAPAGRLLNDEDERELARYCLVLGLWEQVYRAGDQISSPLWTPEPKTTAAEMLAIATPEMVEDMGQLSRLFFHRCGDLIAISAGVVQNPTFAGSNAVGGADADFIAGGCLWDIKTTKRATFCGDWLYQLLGYVLLDFEDERKIRSVGIYLARQGVRLCWPLGELLDTLTGTQKGAGCRASVKTRLRVLRADFRAMLDEMNRPRRIPKLISKTGKKPL